MSPELNLSDSNGIGDRVRAARERIGWSREALAFHSGVSWSAISQVESGRRRNVRPSTLNALAQPLGVSIDYLVRGTPGRTTMLEHSLLPYRSDDQFVGCVGPYLAEGMERSEALLAVTTAANGELLRERFGGEARSIELLDSATWYSTPAAALEAYRSYVEAKLKGGASWVRIVGEPVWAERSDTEIRVWIRYEALLNLVFSAYPVSFICPYDERSTAPEIVRQAHLTHPHTVGEHGRANSPDYTTPENFELQA
jgi:transcriptional regulator with XRE-family HTH domain